VIIDVNNYGRAVQMPHTGRALPFQTEVLHYDFSSPFVIFPKILSDDKDTRHIDVCATREAEFCRNIVMSNIDDLFVCFITRQQVYSLSRLPQACV